MERGGQEGLGWGGQEGQGLGWVAGGGKGSQHRISTARKEMGWGRLFFPQIEPN